MDNRFIVSLPDNRDSASPFDHALPPAGSVTRFYRQLVEGDRSATDGLWQRFFPRLTALARATVGRLPQQVSDIDDAVQSAFISFWQQAERGDFATNLNRDNLWSLLATMTVRKAQKQARRLRTQKRGGGHVLGEQALAGDDADPRALDQLVQDIPTHEYDLVCEEFLSQLDDELRAIVVLRLLGHSTEEIARQLHCTQRKIQRKLQLVQIKWQDFES
jgi:RNA polymerase sigma factor (sigma-70 family)